MAALQNDGAAISYAGFSNGIGIYEAKLDAKSRTVLIMIEENGRPSANTIDWQTVTEGSMEIGIKICEADC